MAGFVTGVDGVWPRVVGFEAAEGEEDGEGEEEGDATEGERDCDQFGVADGCGNRDADEGWNEDDGVGMGEAWTPRE